MAEDSCSHSQSDDKLQSYVDGQVQFFTHGIPNSPLQHFPSEAGLEYETVYIPALDGVMLEAWYIPGSSNKVIVCNHPMTFNKGGYPGKQKGFDGFGPIDVSISACGCCSHVQVNFIPDYKNLHDEGYHVVVYDQRNHGRSQNNWGSPRVFTTGYEEAKDMPGVLNWVRAHPKMKGMEIALYPRCMGANAVIISFKRFPEYYKDIKAMVALQPVSAGTFVTTGATAQGLDPNKALELFDKGCFAEIGIKAEQMAPQWACDAVHCPTLVAQVRDDVFVDAKKDTQEIHDLLATKQKKLYWITGTTRRFDGYNYFPEHPEELINWFRKHFPAK